MGSLQYLFVWDYPTPPRDFPGGFQVRNHYGFLAPYWSSATPLHGGLLTETHLLLPALPLGFHTLLVAAFDRAGHASLEAPWLYVEVLAYPPPVNFQLDLDQKHLRWAFAGAWAPTTDTRCWPITYPLAGFRLRYVPGVSAIWEAALPLHDGLVSDTRFALPPLGAGTYTFLVKAVDRAATSRGTRRSSSRILPATTPQNIVGGHRLRRGRVSGRSGGPRTTRTRRRRRASATTCSPTARTGRRTARGTGRRTPRSTGATSTAPGCYTIRFDMPLEDAGTTLTLDWTGTGPWRWST